MASERANHDNCRLTFVRRLVTCIIAFVTAAFLMVAQLTAAWRFQLAGACGCAQKVRHRNAPGLRPRNAFSYRMAAAVSPALFGISAPALAVHARERTAAVFSGRRDADRNRNSRDDQGVCDSGHPDGCPACEVLQLSAARVIHDDDGKWPARRTISAGLCVRKSLVRQVGRSIPAAKSANS